MKWSLKKFPLKKKFPFKKEVTICLSHIAHHIESLEMVTISGRSWVFSDVIYTLLARLFSQMTCLLNSIKTNQKEVKIINQHIRTGMSKSEFLNI